MNNFSFVLSDSFSVASGFQKKADADLARAREEEKAARSYDILFTDEGEDEDVPRKSVREMEEDFM